MKPHTSTLVWAIVIIILVVLAYHFFMAPKSSNG